MCHQRYELFGQAIESNATWRPTWIGSDAGMGEIIIALVPLIVISQLARMYGVDGVMVGSVMA